MTRKGAGSMKRKITIIAIVVGVLLVIAVGGFTAVDRSTKSATQDIVDDVLWQQSLDVDTVSGATASSKTILKAIENALKERKN
jgi:uncharacterized protein with FMN-binding domain